MDTKYKKTAAGLMLICLAASLFFGIPVQAKGKWPKGPSKSSISAESAIVMDINTGTILYKKNIHDKHYPASITKIMTTLLCLENASLTDTVKFSATAVNSIEFGSSHIGVIANEKLNMEDCLYGIMLMSANEVCNGVAEHIGGSIQGFVDMMNDRAKELGCKNTHFANPNGLYLDDHYTSAYDMALISSAAMKNSVFRKITGTKTYRIEKTNLKEERLLYNKHGMLYPIKWPKYGYEYCIGGKTGYTDKARWTLVTFAKKDDLELVCVVMKTGGPPPIEPNEYTDTTALLNYAIDNYKSYPIEASGNKVDKETKYALFSKYDTFFDDENSPIYIEEGASVVLPNNIDIKDAKKTIEYYDDKVLDDGVNVIGKIVYTYDNVVAGSANIMYDTDKAEVKNLNEELMEYVNEMEESEPDEPAEAVEETEKPANEESKEKALPFGLDMRTVIIIGGAFLFIILLIIIIVIIKSRRSKRYISPYSGGRYNRRRRKKYKF